MNKETERQLRIIAATLENARIDIELLQRENERLREMLKFSFVKTGDVSAEQSA
jgi:cell shape-determining protein MreC